MVGRLGLGLWLGHMLTGSQWRWSSLCSGADIDTGAVVVGASVRQIAHLSRSQQIGRGYPADPRLLLRGCSSWPVAASVPRMSSVCWQPVSKQCTHPVGPRQLEIHLLCLMRQFIWSITTKHVTSSRLCTPNPIGHETDLATRAFVHDGKLLACGL